MPDAADFHPWKAIMLTLMQRTRNGSKICHLE
jgi:hypothetical protein